MSARENPEFVKGEIKKSLNKGCISKLIIFLPIFWKTQVSFKLSAYKSTFD
jgi:hypothetical protein